MMERKLEMKQAKNPDNDAGNEINMNAGNGAGSEIRRNTGNGAGNDKV